MRIGSKLFVAFSVLVFSELLIGGVGLLNLKRVQSLQLEVSNRAVPSMEALLETSRDYLEIRIAVRDLVYATDGLEASKGAQSLKDLDAAFRTHLDQFKTANGGDAAADRFLMAMKGVDVAYEDYQSAVEEMSRLKTSGNDAEAVRLLHGKGAERASDMSGKINFMVEFTKRNVADQVVAGDQAVLEAIGITAGLMVLAAILGAAFSLLLSRSLSRPIRQVSSLALKVSDRDLTTRSTGKAARRKDELGDLGRSVDTMAEGLHEFVVGLNQMGKEIDESAQALDARAAAATEASHRILEAVQRGHDSAQNQAAGITETTATVTQIASTIEKFDRLIEDQAASITQTTAALEQMASNIRSLSSQAVNLQKVAQDVKTHSSDGGAKLGLMVAKIEEMAVQSKKLSDANATIRAVAAQTKMLSLNAAIEAAHAGDAGAGFAVVASEIGSLSEKAARSSQDITQEVKLIQNLIAQTVHESESGRRAFSVLLNSVEDLSRFEAELTGALQEQSVGAEQILEATTQVSQVTAEVRQGSVEILDGSQAIRAEMETLLGHSRRLEADLDHVAAEGRSIDETSAQVLENAARNRELSSRLDAIVGTYRI